MIVYNTCVQFINGLYLIVYNTIVVHQWFMLQSSFYRLMHVNDNPLLERQFNIVCKNNYCANFWRFSLTFGSEEFRPMFQKYCNTDLLQYLNQPNNFLLMRFRMPAYSLRLFVVTLYFAGFLFYC